MEDLRSSVCGSAENRLDSPPGAVDCCSVEKCDIFDFMAKHVGLSVLHPGGFKATRRLADLCRISEGTRVIDIACGKGTSAIYLAQRYGCQVTGLDISEELLAIAEKSVRREGLTGRVRFHLGDALNIPFPDDEFDVAISQAMLVLVKDKSLAVREALRVTKIGGRLGWLELSWPKPPTPEFMEAVSNVLCAYCMQNVLTFEGWKLFFREEGVQDLEGASYPLHAGRFLSMLADEGFGGTVRIMLKSLTDRRIRRRMKTMNRFFKDNAESFSYGVFTGRK